MATYRPIIVEGKDGWYLMRPTSPWEALRVAWLLWRHPSRIACLVGVQPMWIAANCRPVAPGEHPGEAAG